MKYRKKLNENQLTRLDSTRLVVVVHCEIIMVLLLAHNAIIFHYSGSLIAPRSTSSICMASKYGTDDLSRSWRSFQEPEGMIAAGRWPPMQCGGVSVAHVVHYFIWTGHDEQMHWKSLRVWWFLLVGREGSLWTFLLFLLSARRCELNWDIRLWIS